MATAVMGDHSVAPCQEVEQLGIPVVGAERPAVVEVNGLGVPWPPVFLEGFHAIFRRDEAHDRFSSVMSLRRQPELSGRRTTVGANGVCP